MTTTPEQAYHYRDAVCCQTCPARVEGICRRLKVPVSAFKTCDKHPDWRKVHEGHKEGKKP